MFKKEKTNNKNVQTKNKGITLIALVITIIVILILAGVSINTLFGDNGLLKKAEEASEANSHAQVKDEIQLEVHNYEIEKRSESTSLTLIEYLETEKFIKKVNDYYVVEVSKVGDPTLGKGESIEETGDVYVIEKENKETADITKLATVQESDVKQTVKVADTSTGNEDWVLRYYKIANDKNPKTLLNLTLTDNSGDDNPVVSTGKTVADLKVGDYVNYVVNGKTYKSIVLYDNDYNSEKDTSYGIQIVTEDCVEEDVEITGFDFDTLNNKAQEYKNSICTLVRLVGSNQTDGSYSNFGGEQNGSFLDDRGDRKKIYNVLRC